MTVRYPSPAHRKQTAKQRDGADLSNKTLGITWTEQE